MHDPSLAINIIAPQKNCGEETKDSKNKYQSIKREKSAEGNNTQRAAALPWVIAVDVDAAAVSAAEIHKPAVRGKGVRPVIVCFQNAPFFPISKLQNPVIQYFRRNTPMVFIYQKFRKFPCHFFPIFIIIFVKHFLESFKKFVGTFFLFFL